MFKNRSNNNDNKEPKGTKKILKNIFIILLSIIMIVMNIFSYFKSEPKFSITQNMVYIFAIVAVLIIFDTIESLTIGELITLKKTNEQTEQKAATTAEENDNLLKNNLKLQNTIDSLNKDLQKAQKNTDKATELATNAIEETKKLRAENQKLNAINNLPKTRKNKRLLSKFDSTDNLHN